MKTFLLPYLILAASVSAFSQTQMFINKYSGSSDSVLLSNVKSISFKSAPTPITIKGIVFISTRDGNSEIYKINSDGSGETRLTYTPSSENYPRWSPDGNKIAYVSTVTSPAEIYTMNPDGTDSKKITSNNTWGHDNISAPVWINNNEIVYAGTGGTAHWSYWNVNLKTLVHTQIYGVAGDAKIPYDVHPTSGKLFGYSLVDYAHGADDWLFSCNADGSNYARIVNNLGQGNAPWYPIRVNPAGTKIVYPWYNGLKAKPLWTANIDGTGQIKIPNTGTFSDEFCAFSPDGAKIVFGSMQGMTTRYRLWTINTDGTGRTQLTTGTSAYDDMWPDWK